LAPFNPETRLLAARALEQQAREEEAKEAYLAIALASSDEPVIASEALYRLLLDHTDKTLDEVTAFKSWTIKDVIRHLHVWNHAADLSLRDAESFRAFYAQVGSDVDGGGLRGFESRWLNGLAGQALLERWRAFFEAMAVRFGAADPSARVPWAGPSMSVRSSITARLMETWAHGQAVYDRLGIERQNADRIRNIVVLGVNTYGWTFHVRGEAPPEPAPYLELTAPSGEVWRYNTPSDAERISGPAEAFCQVVTQVRNVADTAPYMHNGVFDTLEEVMNFYNRRDLDGIVAEVGTNVDDRGNLGELGLTPTEIQQVIVFLQTLSDR